MKAPRFRLPVPFGPRRVAPLRPGSYDKAPEGLRAAVVGGGIAGLAAATVLAERGVEVTVFEKEAVFGGRLGAWPDTLADGTQFAMERGFHGFFRQYYNLRRLLQRLDPSLSFLKPLRDYPLLGPDGASETFQNLPTTPPFNIIELVRRSPHLPLRELRDVAFWPAIAMMAYDGEATYRRYDNVSATAYLDSLNFTDHARRMLFDVFSHSFFNPESRYSAAELLMNFHFYFVGNPEGLIFDVCDDPFSSCVIDPWVTSLQAQGAVLKANTEVSCVSQEKDGFVIEVEGNEPLEADVLVLATSVPALKQFAQGALGSAAFRQSVNSLEVTDPFYVLRLWLSKPVRPERAPFAGTSGFGLLDNISVYEQFEGESRDWSARHGGSVVELHAYAVPEHKEEAAVREELLNTLHAIYPETKEATILEERGFMRRDCPAFEPGSHALRPTVGSAGWNIGLAGDHLKMPFPTALMERAASSGILAANHLLSHWSVKEEPLYSVPTRGLLAPINRFRRNSRAA